jgi:hypothetical protein
VINQSGTRFRATVLVFRGASLPSLALVAKGFGKSSPAIFNVLSGEIYQVGVVGNNSDYGDIRLDLQLSPSPTNDNFADRISVTGESVEMSGSNVGATKEPNEPDHFTSFFQDAGGHSIWWTWTAPSSGTYSINRTGGD